MKIIIINPPAPDGDVIKSRARQPLGLAWISSVLKRDGHETKLVDMNALQITETQFDDNYEVAIITSSPMDRWETPYLDLSNVYKVFKEAKKAGLTTVLTGPHGTVTTDRMFEECADIDIIIVGEAEETASELMRNLDKLEEVEGIAYRSNDGQIRHSSKRALIQDLDTLPIPDYGQLPMDSYSYNVSQDMLPSPFTIMETSRGCPYQCIFCLKEMHGGRIYRVRSPKSVVAEIKHLQKEFGIKSVYFQDLEFTIQKGRVIDFCKLMVEEGVKLNWACASRVGDVNDELMEWMRKAGCQSISFGVESISRKILNNVKKGTTPEMIKNALELCKKHGIYFNRFYTQGHYGETRKTMEDSLKTALEFKIPHPLDRGAEIIPYPGTEIYERAKEDGLIKDGSWEEVKSLVGKVGTEKNYKRPTIKGLFYFALLRLKGISKKDN